MRHVFFLLILALSSILAAIAPHNNGFDDVDNFDAHIFVNNNPNAIFGQPDQSLTGMDIIFSQGATVVDQLFATEQGMPPEVDYNFTRFNPDDDEELMFTPSAESVESAFAPDTGISKLPGELTNICLSYLNGVSLLNFATSRFDYQLMTERYIQSTVSAGNIQVPAGSFERLFYFLNDCFPILERSLPVEMLSRPMTWIDAAWLSVIARRFVSNDVLTLDAVPTNMPFVPLLIDDPHQPIISYYGISALASLGNQLNPLVSMLLSQNCTDPALYGYVLSFAPNLNDIAATAPHRFEHILFELIERGIYLPTLMDRPELLDWAQSDAMPDEVHEVEFYDVCWELAIECINFEAFKGLISMNADRFSLLEAADLSVLRDIFIDAEGPARVRAAITAFDDSDQINYDILPEIENNEYRLMPICAKFASVPGQHQELFRLLYSTYAYDLRRAVMTLVSSRQYKALRQMLADIPELQDLDPYADRTINRRIDEDNAVSFIELFTCFSGFNIFTAFALMDKFQVFPSPVIAAWIEEMDPQADAFMPAEADDDDEESGQGGNFFKDAFGSPMTLIKYAILLKNPQLVQFCLDRPQNSRQSLAEAERLARYGTNQRIIRKFDLLPTAQK